MEQQPVKLPIKRPIYSFDAPIVEQSTSSVNIILLGLLGFAAVIGNSGGSSSSPQNRPVSYKPADPSLRLNANLVGTRTIPCPANTRFKHCYLFDVPASGEWARHVSISGQGGGFPLYANVQVRGCSGEVYDFGHGNSNMNDTCGYLDFRVTNGVATTIAEAHDPLPSQQEESRTLETSAPRPSFDCANASHTIELVICADPHLASVDAELGQIYGAKLETLQGEDRKRFVDAQRRWITARSIECGIPSQGIPSPAFISEKKSCVLDHIRDRIKAVRGT